MRDAQNAVLDVVARLRARSNEQKDDRQAWDAVRGWEAPSRAEDMPELPLRAMIGHAAIYADQYATRTGQRIALDPLLGSEGLAPILDGLRTLLDGYTGRLDCGALWSMLDGIAKAAGWVGGLDEVRGL